MTDASTPSEVLSTKVVDRLIAAKLLRPEKRDTAIAKIASGGMKGEDWKVEIELTGDIGGQDDSNGTTEIS